MDKVPIAYDTTCSDRKSGRILIEQKFEAVNVAEAETRALLNCVKAGNSLADIDIFAKRI